MSNVKESFSFRSHNTVNTINGFIIRKENAPYKAIIQISHGMVEHINRYEEFMNFMADKGYVMVAHDHLGHKGSVESDDQLGYFAKKDGYKSILDDLATTASRTKKMFPQLKFVLLGHSMGSFYARVFAGKHANLLDGIIISGTGGENPLASVGKIIIKALMLFKGDKYRSKLMKNISFKGFLSKVKNPKTKNDWISSDENAVQEYTKDKYCSFIFTLSGFLDLANINQISNSKECFENFKKNIPVLIFSGDNDPVGDYGVGVRQVYDKLVDNGVGDIELKMYSGGRHEMLNEINKYNVYEDIEKWMDNKFCKEV